MTQFRFAVLALGVGLAVGAPAQADDAADARALVEKAVKAHGGQEKLEKLPGVTAKFKGTFHGQGDGLPMTGEVSSQGPDKQRIEFDLDVGGQKIPILIVFAGDKGWAKIAKDTKEMDKDQIAEAREQGYAGWVATLAPLKDKRFTLAPIGEVEIEKQPALGVKVSSKGHRDVELYFDKKTGLLVKTQGRVKDEGSGQEVTEESFPSDYKDVQGTKQAAKFTVKRNGKLFMEGETIEVNLYEKLDPSTFAKP
jgi:hypothetical protein